MPPGRELTRGAFWIDYLMPLLALFVVFSLDFRGIWVPRWAIDDHPNIIATLDGRFNHVFLQIYALGEAYYPSRIAPVKMRDDAWLRDFLLEAHKRGIAVSAWLNVFYAWGYAPRTADMRHAINMHPNWFLEDTHGRSILDYDTEELRDRSIEGYYLTPANIQVRDYVFDIIDEILERYEFDGVHLDYLRYPSRQFSNDVSLRSEFMREYCIDPAGIASEVYGKRFGVWGSDDLELRRRALMRNSLTEFVRTLASRIKAGRPYAKISVAVKADPQSASNDFFQDWPAWLNEDLVDFVCLMAYSNNIEGVLKRTLSAVNDPRKVTVGLGIYRQNTEQIAAQVRQVAALPFSGVVFFSYEELRKNRAFLATLR